MIDNSFKRLSNDIVIEYIKDSQNLFSESYSVLQNELFDDISFISGDTSTGNTIGDIIVLNDNENLIWALPVNEWIQSRNYGISFPIRYDTLKVYFKDIDDYDGFYINIKVIDNSGRFINLTNSKFEKSSLSNLEKVNFLNPAFIFSGDQFTNSINIKFPSPSALNSQSENGIPTENSINSNLTDGIGISNNPIFVDFYFIKSIDVINGEMLYSLGDFYNISFNTNPSWNDLNISIVDRDNWISFFPTYSGTNGGFLKYIEDEIISGKRYYIEYIVSVFEKNLKISEFVIRKFDNIHLENSWRPIFKWTTTTAIIDIEMKLVDRISEEFISRKNSIVFFIDKVSNFSRYLTKLDLKNLKPKDVISEKVSDIVKNVGTKNSELVINSNPFLVFSKSIYLNIGEDDFEIGGKLYKSNGRGLIDLDLYDNVIKVNIIRDSEKVQLIKPEMSFRDDDKIIRINPYFDSDVNDLNSGITIFKISSSDINRIKSIKNKIFYILSNGKLIYRGVFNLNFKKDVENLQSIILNNLVGPSNVVPFENIQPQQTEVIERSVSIDSEDIEDFKLDRFSNPEEIIDNSTSTINDLDLFWISDPKISIKSYYNKIGYKYPNNLRKFVLDLKGAGFIKSAPIDISTGNFKSEFLLELDKILSYFKTFDFTTEDIELIYFLSDNLSDYNSYSLSKVGITEKSVLRGSSKPNDSQIDVIKRNSNIIDKINRNKN
jgi:hypothetical protein